MKPTESKKLTDCIGNLPPLSMGFTSYLNTTIPIISEEKDIIIHQQGKPLNRILVIKSGLLVAFQTSNGEANHIYYLWRSSETVIFPYSFFKPYIDTDYFVQTLEPTSMWIIDEDQWKNLEQQFRQDIKLLQHALQINFIQRLEELQKLRHMRNINKFKWYESLYGRNLLRNEDVAAFLGFSSSTLDKFRRIK